MTKKEEWEWGGGLPPPVIFISLDNLGLDSFPRNSLPEKGDHLFETQL